MDDVARRAFLAEGFVDYLAFDRGLADRTVEAYRRDLERFVDFLRAAGRDDPGRVTPDGSREGRPAAWPR